MSLWTDRELKSLIARVDELEKRLLLVEGHNNYPVVPTDGISPQPLDKRTKEYKEWKNANS